MMPKMWTGIASDLVIVDDIVQVQGRLTDADGAPIDGNRTIVASLYDVATAGVARCFDSDTVAVNNGLFVMNMDSCTASRHQRRPALSGHQGRRRQRNDAAAADLCDTLRLGASPRFDHQGR
jgi:hypothetical protein